MKVAVYALLLAALISNGQSLRSVALEETAETSANASLGDLDGDGDLDIVLAKGRHWPLVDWVLLNDGAGGFEQRASLSLLLTLWAVRGQRRRAQFCLRSAGPGKGR